MILLWPFEGKKTLKTFMVHPSHGFKPQKKAEAQKAPEASPGRNVRPSVGLVVCTRGVHFVVHTRGVHFIIRTRGVHFFRTYAVCALCRLYTGWGGGYFSVPQISIT